MAGKLMASAAALLLLAANPALAAQDAQSSAETATPSGATTPASAPASAEADLAAMTDMFSGMFTAEPLTAEQEARLPAAERLIAKVIPEGTMGEMMDTMFDSMLRPMLELAPDGATTTVAKQIGMRPSDLTLEDDQVAELASLFDPAWNDRQQREMAVFPSMMKDVVGLMEPGMRKAMSELYAIRFSGGELAQIDAFFSTDAGGKYARESFLMASDPRIMASTMDAMPALMGMMGDIEARMAASTADLPAIRSFADLSPEDRAKVAELTGYSVEEIAASLSATDGAAEMFEVVEAENTVDD